MSLRDADWGKAPPDPLTMPARFTGLLWRRSLAFMFDAAIVWTLNLALAVVFGLAGLLTFGLLWPLGALALAVFPIAYHTYFLGSNGATPGMALFDVELRSWNGRRVDYLQALLQTALFYTTVPMTGGLILIVSLFTERRRTAHDILAGTLALRRAEDA
jgi:uncharacterized RDD family membrane protein YckC